MFAGLKTNKEAKLSRNFVAKQLTLTHSQQVQYAIIEPGRKYSLMAELECQRWYRR